MCIFGTFLSYFQTAFFIVLMLLPYFEAVEYFTHDWQTPPESPLNVNKDERSDK
jgi:hypothetical protein